MQTWVSLLWEGFVAYTVSQPLLAPVRISSVVLPSCGPLRHRSNFAALDLRIRALDEREKALEIREKELYRMIAVHTQQETFVSPLILGLCSLHSALPRAS